MAERFLLGDRWCELSTRNDAEHTDSHKQDFDGVTAARAWLDALGNVPNGMEILRTVSQRVDLAADLSTLTDEALLQRVAWQLVDRELYADGRLRDTPGGGGGGDNPTPGPRTDPPPPLVENDTWIEIHLKTTDNRPLPGERYTLKLADGSVREGTTNSAGAVRIEGIDPGICELKFPDLDRRESTRRGA